MKRKKMMKGIVLTTAAAILLGSGALMADALLMVPDKEMTLEGKKPARFDHTVHTEVGLDCGVCHHDKDKNPLTAEDIGKISDAAQLSCASCHNKDFSNKELRKTKDVFHARCKTCHKEGYAGKKGPVKCSGCHLKTKKKAVEGC